MKLYNFRKKGVEMISSKYLHYVQTLILSGLMSLVMSFAISLINLGFVDGFFHIWMRAWMIAYAIALPTLLVVFPFVRKLAMRIASK